MRMGLEDRVALVTGGSSGIGLATVTLLLEEGARVVTCGRDAERLQSALAPLAEQYGDRLVWATGDVLSDADMVRLVDLATGRFGGIDLLVNNAGRSLLAPFADTTDRQWTDELELKFFGVLRPLRAAQPWLSSSAVGAVVNLNAVLARQPEGRLMATSAARAGLLNLSKSLAGELAPDGIRVNSVCVGLIDTGQWRRRHEDALATGRTAQDYEDWTGDLARDRGIVLGRLGRADEVAAAVVFLLSPRSSYVTGTQIDVAGGVSRYV